MGVTDKVIEIKCGGEAFLDISDMTWFQKKLKNIEKSEFQNLKDSLKKHGIPYGFHVWKDKNITYILDGHHRILALNELRKEGWTIPKVPVNYVKAKSMKEAATHVLIINARYAKMTEESVSDYIIDFKLDHTVFEYLNSPDIRYEHFLPNDSVSALTMGDTYSDYADAAKSTEQIPTMNPNENVKLDEVKEEKMDVVGRRYVIIIDCRDQEHKESIKENIQPLVEEAGGKFF